jgi:hypothetical protein
MIVFPQLSTGAVAQFPYRRTVEFRTLVHQSPDGSEIVVRDLDLAKRAWELSFDEIDDQEWQAIQDLFIQVEGRLQSFLFLEPGANLLSWSELLGDAVWQKDTGISVLEGLPDPLGGTSAGRLSSSGPTGAFYQKLNIPASFRYAGSVWARSSSSGASLKVDDDAGQSVEATISNNNEWKRYSVGYSLSSGSEWVALRVIVPAGASVEVFGPQLEAQPAPSAYKRSLQQAGVYPNARFDQDGLTDRATGVGRHASLIRILWAPSQT